MASEWKIPTALYKVKITVRKQGVEINHFNRVKHDYSKVNYE
jgi:hypothetical protein